MAATAVSFPSIDPDPAHFEHFCPTCRRYMIRDGKQAFRNRSFSCRFDCVVRYRKGNYGISLSKGGVLNIFNPTSEFSPVRPKVGKV